MNKEEKTRLGHFVNPFTDIGFKIIFGQPASKELLITLLNELLAGEHHIENLTFLDKEDHSDNVEDAGIIYDLYCLTSRGEYIIVEMQSQRHSHFIDRTLFYMCRAIGRQVENVREAKRKQQELRTKDLESGSSVHEANAPYGSRYKLSTVYGVFLMNFKEPGLAAKFRTDTVISDRESGTMVNPHFRQVYLQFPYFKKELSECETLYDKLIYALKNMQNWERMPEALKEQVFKRLEELASVANLSLDNRIAYDRALDRFYVNRIVEEDIRREATEEGHAEGLKKGLKEGRKKGRKEGLIEGRKEGRKEGLKEGEKQKALEIARNLKASGMTLSDIIKFTGLTEKDLLE